MSIILLIDDNERISRTIRRRLKKEGYEIHTGVNGRESVDMAFEIKPDLILMDMHMPGMDGYTAVQMLREKGYTGKISAFTASAATNDIPKAIEAGCDFHITKPIDTDFEEKIRNILKEGKDG